MARLAENQSDIVFGLDIGTRSIVGTVGYQQEDGFRVMAQCIKEHETRAMIDGQIHDIAKVGDAIRQVKENLEGKIGQKLREVCIAAAGRVLRTITITIEEELEEEKEITSEDVYSLATLGVERAYEEFTKVNDIDMKFYCVGYTPMRYYMNDYQIGNLEGHKAKKIGIDLIATFLPDDVVDGLHKAVESAGLYVANLTLEPIAAIQVAIPEKFRMLNIALVDVGAGTSDISITQGGTITAYGMIPIAGDSLTDILVQHCLVEFDVAEQIKQQARQQDTIEYLDIFGLPQTITSNEVLALLEDNIHNMTKPVADCIRELNGDKAVSAVFVVGGGGMILGYTEALSKELGIVKERVAIRGEEVLKDIVFENENPIKDSLMVTPVGICLCYYQQSNNFIFVSFNNRRLKLFNNGKLTVADVAMHEKFPNESLFSKRGEALTFKVNGSTRMVRGEQGEVAIIKVNDVIKNITTQVNNGDNILIQPSTAGADASLELSKLPEMSKGIQIIVNNKKIQLPKSARVNGELKNNYYEIQNNDDILIDACYTVEQIAELLDIPLHEDCGILVNDTPAQKDTKVFEGFTVTWESDNLDYIQDSYISNANPSTSDNTNEDTSEVTNTGATAYQNATSNIKSNTDIPHTLQVIVNKAPVSLTGKATYVFVDIFDFIDFDLHDSRGQSIVTNINGRPAEYMEKLESGDVIDIFWRNRNE